MQRHGWRSSPYLALPLSHDELVLQQTQDLPLCYTMAIVERMVEGVPGDVMAESHPARPILEPSPISHPYILLLMGNIVAVMSLRSRNPTDPPRLLWMETWPAPLLQYLHCRNVLTVLQNLWDEGYIWAQIYTRSGHDYEYTTEIIRGPLSDFHHRAPPHYPLARALTYVHVLPDTRRE